MFEDIYDVNPIEVAKGSSGYTNLYIDIFIY